MDTVCKIKGNRLRMEGLPCCHRDHYKPLHPGTQMPGASLPTNGLCLASPSAPISRVCGQEEGRQMADLMASPQDMLLLPRTQPSMLRHSFQGWQGTKLGSECHPPHQPEPRGWGLYLCGSYEDRVRHCHLGVRMSVITGK